MNKIITALCCVLLLMFSSCRRIHNYNCLRKLSGQEITIPASIDYYEGSNPFYANSDSAKATVFFWVDNTECSTCRLTNMNPFYKVFNFCRDSVENVNVMVLFTPSQEKKDDFMDVALYRERDLPIYVDEDNVFYEENRFIPEDVRYHAFLLNDKNQIVLVGDPLAGTAIWNLYRDVLFSMSGDKSE